MTLRERIADLITGGALTRISDTAQQALIDLHKARMALRAEKEATAAKVGWRDDTIEKLSDRLESMSEQSHARGAALRAIAAEEKPSSNATVRRMARMAREALE